LFGQNFRSHVCQSPKEFIHSLFLLKLSGKSKVSKLDLELVREEGGLLLRFTFLPSRLEVNEQIRALNISVDDVLLVNVVNGLNYLKCNLANYIFREATTMLFQNFFKVSCVAVLQQEVVVVISPPFVFERHDIRVLQLAHYEQFILQI